MVRWLAKMAFRVFGWKTDGTISAEIKKGIIIFAPHTSSWDFVIGRFSLLIARVPLKVLIKKESFIFPINIVLKALGGIPVDRGKKNSMVENVAQQFTECDSLFVVVTPEGSRKLVRKWKRGFYLIALEAKVPIILAFIDYGNKTGGIGPVLYPCGDFDKDMDFIYQFYSTKTARYPGNFYLPQHIKNSISKTI